MKRPVIRTGLKKNLSSVSAEYSLNDDGTIKVMNRGFNDEKQAWEDIAGVAKTKDDSGKGWLKVRFFKPFYAAYKIIHLNSDYPQAIVTGPTYGYLWILVRAPAFPNDELQKLIDQAERFGFSREKLIRVDQTKNIK